MFDPTKIADDIDEELDYATVEKVNHATDEVEVEVEMPNPAWGLPGDLYRLIEARNARIADFKGVGGGDITPILNER